MIDEYNKRLLKAEGEIFAMRHFTQNLATIVCTLHPEIKSVLDDAIDAMIESVRSLPTDERTAIFSEAAVAALNECKGSQPINVSPFSVIKGGKDSE